MNSITKLQPDWWVRVPEAERRFLRVLMGTIHEMEEQGPGEVAGFAREWERSLGCFIKTRLNTQSEQNNRTIGLVDCPPGNTSRNYARSSFTT